MPPGAVALASGLPAPEGRKNFRVPTSGLFHAVLPSVLKRKVSLAASCQAEAKRQGLSGARLQQAVDEVVANALRDEIDTLLLVQKGKDLNINVDADVTRRLAEIQVQPKISDPDKFQAFIRENTGMGYEDFKLQMKNQMLTQRVIGQEVARTVTVPEAEAQKFYDEHKSEYIRKESQVFLSQIVISIGGKSAEQVADRKSVV